VSAETPGAAPDGGAFRDMVRRFDAFGQGMIEQEVEGIPYLVNCRSLDMI
jgi:hypothetical protein